MVLTSKAILKRYAPEFGFAYEDHERSLSYDGLLERFCLAAREALYTNAAPPGAASHQSSPLTFDPYDLFKFFNNPNNRAYCLNPLVTLHSISYHALDAWLTCP